MAAERADAGGQRVVVYGPVLKKPIWIGDLLDEVERPLACSGDPRSLAPGELRSGNN